jgi:GH25 family lysozyme M1 (1,4-beta-N-acetylmuramidase)
VWSDRANSAEGLNNPPPDDEGFCMPPTSPVLVLRRALVGLLAVALLVPASLLGPAPHAAAASLPRVIDGPDVASYQHPYGQRIAWRKVKRAGKEFAIIKSTEGTSYRNPWFRRDYAGARRAGLVRGSYHFARPQYPIVRSARAQARYYANRLGTSSRQRKTLPPALDLEVTGGLGRAALVTWAQMFLLELRRQTHRTPMIYTYPYFWTSALGDPAALSRYRLWMASYSSKPTVPHALWQYTSTARVKGIAGGVDMSRFVGDPESWRLLSDGRLPNRWPAEVPGAPQRVSVDYRDGDATVRWLPGDTGSTDIRSYLVTLSPGGQSVTVDGTTFAATLHGLERGKSYEISVAARNAVGRGAWRHLTYLTPLLRAVLDVPPPDGIVYGADGVARVRLTRMNGDPLAGRQITVAQRAVGTETWQPLPGLVTDSRGRAVLDLPQPASSQELLFRYDATGWRPVEQLRTLWVRSAVTAALTSEAVVDGQPVTLSGTVAPGTSGVTVRRQELVDGVWQTVETGLTVPGGAYAFEFTPTPGTHGYRVMAARFSGFLAGYSESLSLFVG